MDKYIQTIGKIIAILPLALLGTGISMLIISPQLTMELMQDLHNFKDHLFAKVVSGYLIAHLLLKYRKKMINALIDFIYDLTDFIYKTDTVKPSECIDGIPKDELATYLLENKEFKIKDAVDYFLIPQYKVELLAKKLEEVCVLVRGDNNRRVFNTNFSRSDLANIFKEAQTAEEIQGLFRKEGSGYTTTPSNLPTNPFTTRSIS